MKVLLPECALALDQLREPVPETAGETWLSLDPNLDGLHGTERHTCNDLRGCGSGKVNQVLVLGGVLRPRDV